VHELEGDVVLGMGDVSLQVLDPAVDEIVDVSDSNPRTSSLHACRRS
jgi:hypothetical protein